MDVKRTLHFPIGERFGRLVVIGDGGLNNDKHRLWLCRCDCGTMTTVLPSHARRGTKSSCGCYRRELATQLKLSHGYARTPEYGVWAGIKARCYNPNKPSYVDYGGRGIRMCDRWRNSFSAFYEDMGHRPSPDLTIERIDNEGDYEPGNCVWAPRSVQSWNRRPTVWLEYKGRSINKRDASLIAGVPPDRIKQRLAKGWSVERAIETPVRPMRKWR